MKIADKDRFGNFVKAPWGKHQVTGHRTAFLDHDFKELIDQEGLFADLEPVSEEKVDEILAELGADLAPAQTRETPNHKRERTEQENEHALALLVDNCAFIQHTRDDARELSEPEWWSMCTILVPFGEAGERLIHDFSRPYQKGNQAYSENETQDKINQIRAAQADETGIGPQSCRYIWDTHAFDCPADCQAKLLGVASPAGMASRLTAKAKQKEPSRAAEAKSGQTLRSWHWSDRGLFKLDSDGAEKLVVGIPLEPQQILVTPEGRQALQLEMQVRGRKRPVALEDSWVAKRSNDAAKDLAEYGVPATPKDAYVLQQFVADVLRTDSALPQNDGYRTLGWHGGSLFAPGLNTAVFMPPGGLDWLSGYGVVQGEEDYARFMWSHLMEIAALDAPAIHCAIGTALAAPLLSLLPKVEVISFTAHFHAPGTGIGKTILLRLASATMGDPDKIFIAWDATKVGLEQILGALRHFPLFLDELGDAKQGVPTDFIMMLSQDKGRQRGAGGGGLRPTAEWRSIALSSGNMPIGLSTAHHARRVLSMPAALPSEDFADEALHVSQECFGWPLRWCQALYHTPNLTEHVRELAKCYQRLYTGELLPLKPQALLWSCAEIGTRMLLTRLDLPEELAHSAILRVATLSAMRRQAEGVDYVQRLVDAIREEIATDPGAFGIYGEKARRGNRGRILDWNDEEGSTPKVIAVLPTVAREIAQRSAIPDLIGTLQEARDRGLLITDRDKTRLLKTTRVGQTVAKCYVFEVPEENESVTPEGNDQTNNFEATVTPCYHQDVFVTPVTPKG